jgi:multiple sugar transport system substrate-binding protein
MIRSPALSRWRKVVTAAMLLSIILAACKHTPKTPAGSEPLAATSSLPGVESVAATQVPAPVDVTPNAAPETVTLTFATDDVSLGGYERLADDFNATHPTIKVVVKNINRIKGNWSGFAPTPEMLSELASNVDTFLLPEAALPVGLDGGAFLDLTPLAEVDPSFTPDDFFPGLLAHFRHEGRLWGLPASAGAIFIFYNKRLFDQAGVDYPAPGWTWDDFLSTATRLTAGTGSSKQFGFYDAWELQGMHSFIQQHGGDLLDRTGPYPNPALDSPLVAEAVQWYVDLTVKHGVSPRKSDIKSDLLIKFIKDQRLAMWTDGLENWQGVSRATETEIGVAPFPEDQAAANPVGVSGYVVSAGAAHPQACWQWLLFLTEQQVVNELVNEPVERLPVRRSVFEASGYFAKMGDDARAAILYVLEHPASSLTTYDLVVLVTLLQSLAPVWEGEATVDEALAQAQSLAEEQVAQAVTQAVAGPTPPPIRPVPSPTPDAAPVSLTFLIDEGLDAAPYQALADQFSQGYPDVNVTIGGHSPLGLGENAGSADCFLWPSFALSGDWRQHVVPLDPFLEDARDSALDDFYPHSLTDLRDGGDLWGMPLFLVPELVYFNKDLFDAAGVSYPVPDWRWGDLRAAAEALTGGEGDTRQYGFAPSGSGVSEAMAFILQRGASLLDDPDHPTVPTFNTQEAVEALNWYADLARLQVMPPLWETGDPFAYSERGDLIRSGRVAMWTDSPWPGNPGYDFALGAVPLPGDRREATDFDTWGAYISAYSPYPAQCWDWLVYLSDHLLAGPGIPARRSLAEGGGLTQGEDKAACLASVDHENIQLNRWRDRTSWMGWVYPWFEEAVRDVLLGQASASQALERTQARAEAFLLCLESPGEILSQEEALACAREVDPTYPAPSSGNP